MEIFTVTGHSLLSPGYTSILTWQALGSSDTLPKFTPNEKVNIQEVKRYSYYLFYLFTHVDYFLAMFLKREYHAMTYRMSCFIIIGQISRMLYTTAGLFNRGRINISHGKTWHRDRRLDPCAYK